MTIANTTTIRVVAVSSATGLVLASAGFGALYAYKVGIQHGYILAGLSVLMALALEAVKPLAIAAGLDTLKRGGPAALLLTLGGISCGYSLTAELSLISMSKGDLVAERQAEATTARNAAQDRKRIEAELSALGIVRPAKAIQSDLDSILSDGRLKGCIGRLDSWRLQTVCTEKAAPLRAELANAERREALEASLAQPHGPQIAKEADPGSLALATYLAALGLNLSAEVLSQWLILIPVLALEGGSALAGVLVQAVSQSPVKRVSEPPRKPANRREPPKAEPAAGKDKVAKAIVQELQAAGGSLSRSERGLARLIGTSKPTARRAIHGLAAAGVVALEATKAGTVLRLVA